MIRNNRQIITYKSQYSSHFLDLSKFINVHLLLAPHQWFKIIQQKYGEVRKIDRSIPHAIEPRQHFEQSPLITFLGNHLLEVAFIIF